MNEILLYPSHTPIDGHPSGIFVAEVLYWKLLALAQLETSTATTTCTFADCDTTVPASATSFTTVRGVPWVSTSSSLDSRVIQKQYPRVCDSIASRLPARSQATNHRLLVVRTSTSIAERLLPRIVNAATQNRGRTRAIPNRKTRRIGLGIRKRKSAQRR